MIGGEKEGAKREQAMIYNSHSSHSVGQSHLVRTTGPLICLCSATSSGELLAHSSSRALSAVVVA